MAKVAANLVTIAVVIVVFAVTLWTPWVYQHSHIHDQEWMALLFAASIAFTLWRTRRL